MVMKVTLPLEKWSMDVTRLAQLVCLSVAAATAPSVCVLVAFRHILR